MPPRRSAARVGTHPYVVDPDDPLACWRCRLPAGNRIHTLPPRTDAEKAYETRKVGDR